MVGVPAFRALGFGLSPQAAAASRQFGTLEWNWNPWILASLALAAFAYVRGLRRMIRAARSENLRRPALRGICGGHRHFIRGADFAIRYAGR
jgi:hypothetical protein